MKRPITKEPSMLGSAVFSPDQKYRFELRRWWVPEPKRWCNFLMLNGSRAGADPLDTDNTVTQCITRAFEYGYDGLIVTNLFALMSTYPHVLYDHPDPIGEFRDGSFRNNQYIVDAARVSDMVVCAWGSHGNLNNRGREVRGILSNYGIQLHYLRMTLCGQPCHPLRIPYAEKPKEWAIK